MTEIIVDNFAGGGGASTGIERALGRPIDYAINHDAQAIAMHRVNHPRTHHLNSNVWDVSPQRLAAGRQIGLGWFSPDCTFHSKARGGKPFRDRDQARRRRGLAWLIPYWMKAVRPRVVMLENVEEFADWGPLLDDGSICQRRRGMIFRRWHSMIENLGYRIDMRELVACDYGAPTKRKRLFVIARCDGQEIVFPEASHGHGLQPYRTAADCIDWSLPCPSIFERARPLAEATMRRIARGVMRYCINSPNPFVPWLVAFALRDDGWYLRSAIIWAKPNGMPGSQDDRPTSSYELIFLLSKSERYWSDFDAIKTPPRESSLVRLAQDVQAQAGSHRANGGGKTNGPMKAVAARERERERERASSAGIHDVTPDSTSGGTR